MRRETLEEKITSLPFFRVFAFLFWRSSISKAFAYLLLRSCPSTTIRLCTARKMEEKQSTTMVRRIETEEKNSHLELNRVFFSDPIMSEMIRKAAEKMNLRKHVVGLKDGPKKELYTCGDLEVKQKKRGKEGAEVEASRRGGRRRSRNKNKQEDLMINDDVIGSSCREWLTVLCIGFCASLSARGAAASC